MHNNDSTPQKGNAVAGFFKNIFVKTILLTAALVLAIILCSDLLLSLYTRHNDELTVPDMVGMSTAEASEIASLNSMYIEVVDSMYVDGFAPGAVYRQIPAAGEAVKKGRRISLTINASQPKMVYVPDLIGYSMRQAKAELSSRGLRLGRLIYREDIATNNVLDQQYRGKRISPGDKIKSEESIDLVLGLNPEQNSTFVPTLYGCKAEYAVSLLKEHSLNVGTISYDHSVKDLKDSLKAVVFRQVPEPSEYPVPLGVDISIYLTIDESKLPSKDTLQTTPLS